MLVEAEENSDGRPVPAWAGQGLPELPRGPRNASRPRASGREQRVVRPTAGKQTMPGLGQTADSPCPAHAGTLELVWGIVKNCKKLGGDRRHALALPATVR